MTALVSLPCSLPGDTELLGDLGPADAEVDSTVDECIELGLRFVSCRSTAFEPL
jgi:hypothetical protein